jgi:endogenous inhibitor of DNA gyrase (YacG/DUF329 family)
VTEPPTPTAADPDAPALPPCPICARPGLAKFRPFCSKRCADADLGRWFTESYRVPARQHPESGDDETG